VNAEYCSDHPNGRRVAEINNILRKTSKLKAAPNAAFLGDFTLSNRKESDCCNSITILSGGAQP
jgi:hypothetical protein